MVQTSMMCNVIDLTLTDRRKVGQWLTSVVVDAEWVGATAIAMAMTLTIWLWHDIGNDFGNVNFNGNSIPTTNTNDGNGKDNRHGNIRGTGNVGRMK